MDEAGSLLPDGERGEIVVRGSLVMAGYDKNPEATAEVSKHGWHHTGDIGFLDDEGLLRVVDRATDMIISGGFNGYSAEVEQALMQHPTVADCGVVGLPDEIWPDLPRFKVGKVLKTEVKQTLSWPVMLRRPAAGAA